MSGDQGGSPDQQQDSVNAARKENHRGHHHPRSNVA